MRALVRMSIELVSKSEYARRRGCTESAVRRAVKDGRISEIDGKIDPVAADAQWSRNTQVRAGSRPAGQGDGVVHAPVADESDEDSYWASRARRERTEADLAELRLAEQRGQLVRAADVRATHARKLASLREALLQLPARVAPVLAAETDAARIDDVLQAELTLVLAHVTGGDDGRA